MSRIGRIFSNEKSPAEIKVSNFASHLNLLYCNAFVVTFQASLCFFTRRFDCQEFVATDDKCHEYASQSPSAFSNQALRRRPPNIRLGL